jgi:hypothetical protein
LEGILKSILKTPTGKYRITPVGYPTTLSFIEAIALHARDGFDPENR